MNPPLSHTDPLALTLPLRGSRLIEAFAAQLGGHVSVQSEGRTVVTVSFPRVYGDGTEADDDQPRPAQNGSSPGSMSMKAILLSIHARSSSRT